MYVLHSCKRRAVRRSRTKATVKMCHKLLCIDIVVYAHTVACMTMLLSVAHEVLLYQRKTLHSALRLASFLLIMAHLDS